MDNTIDDDRIVTSRCQLHIYYCFNEKLFFDITTKRQDIINALIDVTFIYTMCKDAYLEKIANKFEFHRAQSSKMIFVN